jgi:hypothetical protein
MDLSGVRQFISHIDRCCWLVKFTKASARIGIAPRRSLNEKVFQRVVNQ